jgi:PKD repeat protein
MRNFVYAFLLGTLFCAPSLLTAQQLQPLEGRNLHMPQRNFSRQQPFPAQRITAATCGLDTVSYPIAKATAIAGLLVNNATSAAKIGQYYNCPQPITLHGFRFYGWKTDANGGISTNAVCQVFAASPIDSTPTGAALATVNVPLDTNFGGGNLAVLQKVAMFNSPITVTGPYVLVVGNPSPNSIGVGLNDYQVGDGALEWLGYAELGGTWQHGYEVVLGPYPFNCDVLLDPLVTYDLAANFSHTPSCVAAPGNVNFVNTSSPVFMDRMYNPAVFLGIGGVGVIWDFGDGTVVQQVTQMDTVHGYAAAGNYIVTLVDTLINWTFGVCTADTFITLGGPPIALYGTSINGNIVDFTDQTGSVNATYSWDFGDGNTSSQQNPQHTYATLGNFTACLTVTDACGTDSVCHNITITAVGVSTSLGEGAFTLYPNPVRGESIHAAIQLPLAEQVGLRIYNSIGQLAHATDLGEVQAGRFELPVKDLAPGQYLVQLRTPTAVATQRMQVLR